MNIMRSFDELLNKQERHVINALDSPQKIQTFLDSVTYSSEERYRCPLQVLRDRVGHCFDSALFAAACLRRIGFPPLILDMIPNNRDDDHLLALFKLNGHWGAVAKSNFAGLRFREPIYRNLRELVISYFEQYYNIEREKTLRGYTVPLNLKTFDRFYWMISDEPLELIAQRTDEIRRFYLFTPEMASGLSLVDERSYKAGLEGAKEDGLFKPST
ncbi:MAG: transglutaminase domain-containing protein [Calditrichaceae bacterium]|nr:transglutaminase domain-containing protein [Calditrichaceae bacterium]MBN2710219.1 transglutaminase domain-containing protein [Calditrichaceae bacterium]RQV92858.1 MAG: transglutaminase domain-containing protein [Calditrichota bacterium]